MSRISICINSQFYLKIEIMVNNNFIQFSYQDTQNVSLVTSEILLSIKIHDVY